MPRRRRTQWRTFKKRVGAVIEKKLASNYLVLTRIHTLTTTADKQNHTSIHTVLGLNGSSGGGCNDVNTIAGRVSAITGAPAHQNKFMITGWMAETQIVNIGDTTAYIDLYYWRCYKKVPTIVDGVACDAGNLFVTGLQDLGLTIPPGGSSLDSLDYGVTPFQSPQFYKSCRVMKKTRVKLSAGSVTQIETRSGKNYMRNWSIDEDYGMDRCTEGVLMIAYGTPTATVGTAAPITLKMSTNINYTFKILEGNILRGGTNAA